MYLHYMSYSLFEQTFYYHSYVLVFVDVATVAGSVPVLGEPGSITPLRSRTRGSYALHCSTRVPYPTLCGPPGPTLRNRE